MCAENIISVDRLFRLWVSKLWCNSNGVSFLMMYSHSIKSNIYVARLTVPWILSWMTPSQHLGRFLFWNETTPIPLSARIKMAGKRTQNWWTWMLLLELAIGINNIEGHVLYISGQWYAIIMRYKSYRLCDGYFQAYAHGCIECLKSLFLVH